MKTVQMTLDEPLLTRVDEAVRRLNSNRSAFTREALKDALDRLVMREQEERHRRGYERFPVEPDEFGDWEGEQVWPD